MATPSFLSSGGLAPPKKRVSRPALWFPQPAEPETNSEEQSTLPVKTEEGTILLTPEEIRAALDAGTLDASNIDTACLTDENGLLSWLWNLLFGKRDDDSIR